MRAALRRRLGTSLVAAAVALGAIAGAVVLGNPASAGVDGWALAGPSVFLEQLAAAPDGAVLAGGAGLWLRRPGGSTWSEVGPFSAYNTVLALTLAAQGAPTAYVGASDGLYVAPALGGPYRKVLVAQAVHAVAVDPAQASQVWASSAEGFWRSSDAGRTWALSDGGIASASTAWAMAWSGGHLYASTGTGVYAWSGTRWTPSSNQYGVVSLDPAPGGALFAASMGDGVRVLRHGRWSLAEEGLIVRNHGGAHVLLHPASSATAGPDGRFEGPTLGVHVVSVNPVGAGHLLAGTMLDGIDSSTNGGATWRPAWPGLARLGVVWRIVRVGGHLLAATDSGLIALGG